MNLTKHYPKLVGSLFVVTYGRSGSTILSKVLNSIPGAEIKGENFHALLPIFEAIQRARRAKREHGGNDPTTLSNPWYGAEKIQPSVFQDKLVSAYIDNILNPSKDVRYIGCKEIRYSSAGKNLNRYLNFILSSFPNAKIIFNTRNPLDTSSSGWYKKMDQDWVIQDLQSQINKFEEFHKNNRENTFLVRYEDFKGNPDYFKSLFNFIGEKTFDRDAIERVLNTQLTHLNSIKQPSADDSKNDI